MTEKMYGKSIPEMMKDFALKIDDMMVEYVSESLLFGTGYSSTRCDNNGMSSASIINAINAIQSIPKRPPDFKIYENRYMTETVQTKFPLKKKNRRWDKKYRKKYSKTIPMESFYVDKLDKNNPKIYCHPMMTSRIYQLMKEV